MNASMRRPLEAPAVSVRLRRLWLGEAVREPSLASSDFADVWPEVALRRVGSTLLVHTPFDFGVGDPFAGPFGSFLRSRVSDVSGGAIRELSWEFDPGRRPARRAQT